MLHGQGSGITTFREAWFCMQSSEQIYEIEAIITFFIQMRKGGSNILAIVRWTNSLIRGNLGFKPRQSNSRIFVHSIVYCTQNGGAQELVKFKSLLNSFNYIIHAKDTFFCCLLMFLFAKILLDIQCQGRFTIHKFTI